jgi:hypothetical protein
MTDEWYFRECAESKVGTYFFLVFYLTTSNIVMNVWKLKEEIITELQKILRGYQSPHFMYE